MFEESTCCFGKGLEISLLPVTEMTDQTLLPLPSEIKDRFGAHPPACARTEHHI